MLAVACLIGGYAFSGADETATPPDAIGKFRPAAPATPVPTASFTDRAGNPVSLDDLRGKVVILNVWATWCPPCIKEMPSLAALAATLDPSEVTLLAVSEDIQGETMVGPFLASRDLSALAIRLDPRNTLLKAFHLRGLPTTVILDAQGRELGRLEGGTDWSTAYIRELIRSYIGTGSAKPPPVSKT